MTIEFDADGFPKPPEYRAMWCPIYMEPIAQSGERITVAIVVKSKTELHIQSIIRPPAIRALYGIKAAGVRGITELAVDSLKAHIEKGGAPSSWHPPLTGVFVGEWREAAGLSLRDVLSQAVQRSASLSWVDLAVTAPGRDEQVAHDVVKLRWIDAVKDVVANSRIELLPFFEQDGILVDNGQPVRFGFLGRAVVAHFGVMRPRKLAMSYKDARGRLWELRLAQKRSEFKHAGLILHLPGPDDPNFDSSELAAANDALSELDQEAREDSVTVRPVHTSAQAAEELVNMAA
jgi:hypothetical protein